MPHFSPPPVPVSSLFFLLAFSFSLCFSHPLSPSLGLYLIIPSLFSPLSSSSHFLGFIHSLSLSLCHIPSLLRFSVLLFFFIFFPCCVLMQNGMFYTSYVSTFPCLVKQVSELLTGLQCSLSLPSCCIPLHLSLSLCHLVLAFFGDTAFKSAQYFSQFP